MDEMSVARAHINPEMLLWAIERASTSSKELAEKMKKSDGDVRSWLYGNSKPTFKQAQDIARRLSVPFGFLFLDTPPDDKLPIKDFRRVHNAPDSSKPSVDLREVINDVLRKQEWFAEYQRDHLEKQLPFVRSFSIKNQPSMVAADMSKWLGFDGWGCRRPSRSTFFREFSKRAQAIGVLVMKSGVAGKNTHRGLDVEEFRGFAISDPYAPAVFVNGKDALAAQVFTLAHELAHIWVGETGVSEMDLVSDLDDIEQFCNRVAGDLLVPWHCVQEMWSSTLDQLNAWKGESAGTEIGKRAYTMIRKLAERFRVSTVMIARHLREHKAINKEAQYKFHSTEVNKRRPKPKSKSGGGNSYRTTGARNSRLLTEAVAESMRESRTTVRDASHLLGVKPKDLKRYLGTMGIE